MISLLKFYEKCGALFRLQHVFTRSSLEAYSVFAGHYGKHPTERIGIALANALLAKAKPFGLEPLFRNGMETCWYTTDQQPFVHNFSYHQVEKIDQ